MEGMREGGRVAPGFLPHSDPDLAVRFQAEHFPEMPAWPRLPKRECPDAIAFPETAGMPLLTWPQPDTPILHTDHPGFPEVTELLRSENAAGPLDRGAFRHDDAPGFYSFMREAPDLLTAGTFAVKGQCTGPVTMGLSIRDGRGHPVLASKEGMEALREFLLLHLKWQATRMMQIGRPLALFLEEPATGASFRPEDYGLDAATLVEWMRHLGEPLQEMGVVVGLEPGHGCGRWIFETPVEMVHFKALDFMPGDREAEDIHRFLRQGGAFIWGMVSAGAGSPIPPAGELWSLWERTADRLAAAGIRREMIEPSSLFSIEMGPDRTTPDRAAAAAALLAEFIRRWKEERRHA